MTPKVLTYLFIIFLVAIGGVMDIQISPSGGSVTVDQQDLQNVKVTETKQTPVLDLAIENSQIVDRSPSAHPVTPSGAVSIVDGAIRFDGGYLPFADHADWNFGAEDFAIEVTFRLDALSGTQYLVTQWREASGDQVFQFKVLGDGKLVGGETKFAGGTVKPQSDPGAVKAGVIHTAKLAREGDVLNLYLDGAIVASAQVSGVIADSTRDLLVSGVDKGTVDNTITGEIFALRILTGTPQAGVTLDLSTPDGEISIVQQAPLMITVSEPAPPPPPPPPPGGGVKTLVAFAVAKGAPGIVVPAGWELACPLIPNHNINLAIAHIDADVTGEVVFETASAIRSAWIAIRLADFGAVVAGEPVIVPNSMTHFDPPALDAGAANALFLAVAAVHTDDAGISGFPANLTNGIEHNGNGGDRPSVAIAWDIITGQSLDPGIFQGPSKRWAGNTLAILPGSGSPQIIGTATGQEDTATQSHIVLL